MNPVVVVSHHDPDMLPLAVGTAKALLEEGVVETGLDRHWLHGPHLRVWTTTDQCDLVSRTARRVLEDHPSSATIDPDDYARTSEVLGTTELVPGPYLPLREDNVVERDDEAVERTQRLIGAETVALKRRVLARLLPAVAASGPLGEIPPALRLLGPMTVLASRWQVGGARSGYLTFRSHLEDHLNLHDRDGVMRARFDAAARSSQAYAEQLVASALDEVEVSGPKGLRRGAYLGPDPVLRIWSQAVAEALEETSAAYDAGLITEDLGPGYTAVARTDFTSEVDRWTFDERRSYSDFHRTLRSLNTLEERVHVREFAAYRFVVNQFIRTASVLDVSPTHRYFCSQVFSEAVEGYFDTPWTALLEQARTGAPA